ncbi:MAG: type II toxin-antitoxin system VapC family toxin [Proteobacteria bacterium]|nr:type II toxin-antitoxin system VapC family toxin [Pseudomonadota bacterium]
MIVIDTSAVVAVLRDEPEQQRFSTIIESAQACYMSAASLLETRIVLFTRLGETAVLAVDSFVMDAGVDIVEVTRQTSDIDILAQFDYGLAQSYGDPTDGRYRRWPGGRGQTGLPDLRADRADPGPVGGGRHHCLQPG